MIKITGRLSVLALVICCTSCQPRHRDFSRTQLLMGHVPVTIQIRALPHQRDAAFRAMENAYRQARHLEARISEYQADSEISCLNRQAGRDFCPISSSVRKFLKISWELSQKTQGAFDLRFASPTRAGRSGEIQWDTPRDKAKLVQPDTRLGVGAIGKGWIIDQMLQVLKKAGFESCLINGGGDLIATGGPWKIALPPPQAAPGIPNLRLELKQGAIATSGNDQQPGHIHDPITGKSLEKNQNVTVIAGNLTQADALATAFYVLGEARTKALLKKFQGITVIWQDGAGPARFYGEKLGPGPILRRFLDP